jgi:hypothetical protein
MSAIRVLQQDGQSTRLALSQSPGGTRRQMRSGGQLGFIRRLERPTTPNTPLVGA